MTLIPARTLDDAPLVLTGRGAVSNPVGRFARERVEAQADGWDTDPELPEFLATTLLAERARTVITRNDSPDVPFDRSVNPYRGCEHGCVYCYARPAHAYVDLSPGIDFETRLFFKEDAPRLLARELAKASYVCRPMALGTNTDPYQPVERRTRLTRSLIEVLAAHGHPLTITTRSALVLRDLDLLVPLAERGLVSVAISLTTLDDELKRRMEPRAPGAAARLRTIRALRDAGVPVGVMTAPLIPAINDGELEALLDAAAEAGATHASWILLRLPHEVAPLFEDWLRAHFPERAERVLSLVAQARGGRRNDPRFGVRMTGSGPYAALLDRRFTVAARRLGLDGAWPTLTTRHFRVPGDLPQLDLF
ncbi:MAG: PA0069 family radical SAM protein [Pseudomonadales bacterium]|jgi:DNA repair photolyase|nr:PA0069 family radical SAM protein [Pseudomonadales bacterium]